MPVASSGSSLGVSELPYILPQHLLRVPQKAKSHLAIINEPVLVTVSPGDECGLCAGWVKGPAACAPRLASLISKMIMKGLSVRDRACKT